VSVTEPPIPDQHRERAAHLIADTGGDSPYTVPDIGRLGVCEMDPDLVRAATAHALIAIAGELREIRREIREIRKRR
jgi:hypothetical protein